MTITADSGLLDLNIKEVLQYRDLIVLFVKRDFTSLYKQTILGPLWAVIQPLLTTVVFTVIFGNLARLTTADVAGDFVIPGFLFYMSGNICWTYFANTVQATAGTFINNRATMGKLYYPRLVAPISTACSNLIAFGILIATSGVVEILDVVGSVPQGNIFFPRFDGAGQLRPFPVFLIDVINHRLLLLVLELVSHVLNHHSPLFLQPVGEFLALFCGYIEDEAVNTVPAIRQGAVRLLQFRLPPDAPLAHKIELGVALQLGMPHAAERLH